jgi:hypothetical protein
MGCLESIYNSNVNIEEPCTSSDNLVPWQCKPLGKSGRYEGDTSKKKK